MIIKGKAVTPKASSATSIYPAVILNIYEFNDVFTYLQVFCPSVMSGSLIDAKCCSSNWIDAPVYAHSGPGVLPYDYQIGGIVLISFQDGNVNSPQFVRLVPVDNKIIIKNQRYIEGARVTVDTPIFDDIMDPTVDINTGGLQKGLTLLKAVQTCGESLGCFHTYGYDGKGPSSQLEDIQYLTIYRCGSYGTEFVYKQTNSLLSAEPKECNFDYIESAGLSPEYNAQNIMRFLMTTEHSGTIDENLIDVVNKSVIEFETNSAYKKAYYDKNNRADVLYWYTKIAGYVFAQNKDCKYDTSTKMSPSMRAEVDNENLQVTKLPSDSRTRKVLYLSNAQRPTLNDEAIPLYRGTFRTDNTLETTKSLTYEFIATLWKNLSKNKFFKEKLDSRYAMIVSSHLYSMRETYNAPSLVNKALIICAVIATAFPVIEQVIVNFDLVIDDEKYSTSSKNFMSNMKDLMKNQNPSISPESVARNFRDIYFETLGFPVTTNNMKLFEQADNPHTYIYNKMLAGVNYVLNNYNNISETLDDNENTGEGSGDNYGFIWPIPGVTTITSPFGYRIHPISGQNKLHTGIDIAGNSPYGKNVLASMAGTVEKVVNSYSANNGKGYGNYVLIKHNSTYKTRYAHLLNATVKVGDKVSQGQIIGKCDSTGDSTGSHLHFEIIVNGNPDNPLKYVSANDEFNPSKPPSTSNETYYNVNLSHDVQDHLFKECSYYGIPTALMIALIRQESNFNPNAVGKNSNGTQDEGLCQLNNRYSGTWAKQLGMTNFDPFDPKQNITIGCYVLGQYVREYGVSTQSLHKSLMCYNMGPGTAAEKWKQGVYTSAYSIAVMGYYDQYKR